MREMVPNMQELQVVPDMGHWILMEVMYFVLQMMTVCIENDDFVF